MPDVCEEYRKALRMGERSYRDALAKGYYPYLQVLEEIINHISIVREEKLGIQEIPMDAINGTYASGRRTAFAPNYMPLLDYNSEFAFKWSNLCKAHLNEGIKDAITCYEYLNRYYVVEGNKRVSVLKFFGNPSITANVTRLVPMRSTSKVNIVYYEFLDFYKICPVNFIVFTEPGSYQAFLELTKEDPTEIWTQEEMLELKATFTRFKNAYLAKGGKKLKDISVSDAYLTYINALGYAETKDLTPDDVEKRIAQVWEEIEVRANENSLELSFDAEEAPKKGLIRNIIDTVIPEKVVKIAFVHSSSPEQSDWVYQHELGRMHVSELYKGKITTVSYDNVTIETIQDTLDQAVKDGADLIFATSRIFLRPCLQAAIKYPKVIFLDCTLRAFHKAVRTYNPRVFEAKFLCGIIAGCLSESNHIGYVCNTPVPINITNLNAFALGVKIANPVAKVHAQWTSEIGSDPKGYFWDHGINLISGQDMISANQMHSRDFGLYRVENDVYTNLAMPITNWGTLYAKLLASIHAGIYDDEGKTHGNQAINYWWGMPSGVVDLIISEKVPKETARMVNFLKDQIANGTLHPFSGYICAQDRVILDNEYRSLSPEEIMNMDWLCDNIIGHIPSFDELDEEGQKHMSALPKAEELV